MSEQGTAWQRGILRWRYFVIMLLILLLVFAWGMHGMLREKASVQAEHDLSAHELLLADEEFDMLSARLATVGSDGHIENLARQSYSFLRKDEQRFEIANPEYLDGYTYEELKILQEETKSY